MKNPLKPFFHLVKFGDKNGKIHQNSRNKPF
nr:MAG TPA: hypothetical protein [Caudoviricetes sp.]